MKIYNKIWIKKYQVKIKWYQFKIIKNTEIQVNDNL